MYVLRDILCGIFRDGSQGRIQDFKLGGDALKKIAPSRGRRKICWGISCEKSRFYANFFVSNFRGARAGCAPPPPPWIVHPIHLYLIIIIDTGFTLVPHILYFVCYVVFSVHPIRLYLIIIMDTGFTLVPHILYFVCYVVFSVHPIRLYLIIIMDTGFTLVPHILYFVCYVVFSVHPIRLYLIIIMDTGFTLVPHILYFVCYVVFSVHPIRLYLIIIMDTGFTLVPTHISYFVCYVVFSVHPIRLYLIIIIDTGCTLVPHISYFQCILSVCILLCRLNQVNCGTSYIPIYRVLSVSVCYLSRCSYIAFLT